MEKKGKLLMRKYEFGKLLGQGNYAKVYHARNIWSGQSVAIKVIDKEKVLKIGLIEQTKREISIMRLVKHPNVVQLYEVMATKTKIYIVMEYAKGGELFAKVAKGRLKEELGRTYFQQLISAVDFCHGNGVYHRDLKPENLLLDENGTLKVTDFGLSALHKSRRRDGLLHTTCGTPAYVAPEVVSRKGYDGAKADTWSCGVILFVLLAGHLPFHDSNIVGMYRKMSKGEYKCPTWFSSDVRKLLSRILDPNPSTRAPISKIRENPWFSAGLCNSNPVGLVAEFRESGSETKQETRESGSETKQEKVKLTYLNAFDIISLARGFDLSGLFGEDDERRKVVKFTSKQAAVAILVKFQELAGCLKLRTSKKEAGFVRLENEVSSIDVEIFEFTPSFHLVEMKTSGNALVFQKQVKEEIKPVLEDIIWAWQG